MSVNSKQVFNLLLNSILINCNYQGAIYWLLPLELIYRNNVLLLKLYLQYLHINSLMQTIMVDNLNYFLSTVNKSIK